MASALHEAGGDEHLSPGGGSEVAHDATPRHRLRGLGMGIHVTHSPTCLQGLIVEKLHPHVHLQGATVEQLHPPM